MKPTVYITRKIPDEIVNKIAEECTVRMWGEQDIAVPKSVLEQEIEEADGLFCLLTETIDKTMIEKAKKLKIISNMAVGYNNIDVNAAKAKNILVTNTPDVLTETTADLTFSLLMATARRVVEASAYLRKGKWKTWSPMQLTGQDIYGATIGIIGMGRIGEALARRAKGFNMNIIYFNRNRKQKLEEEIEMQYQDLNSLLRNSDFICIMTPYSSETRGLISEKELSLMKKSAILINTARGGIVDEDALYYALRKGELWAAGLDVFMNEPISVDHPLLTLPNVVATPHIGSASIQTRLKMADLAAENLLLALKGRIPKYVI
ncbi:2-hydroxyacid dehydrogenase [Niallia sp. JL1B1071]|uniref:2-hydroxyacid dehydrogenase n=1 Tax=Niallia tiangongensis TaxID=3237105 RepID=UPI0037DCDAF8